MPKDFLVIGIGNHILAIDKSTGEEIWRTQLGQAAPLQISLHIEDEKVFAGYFGRLYCLETRTGKILWKNNLRGLGNGLVAIKSVREGQAES